jgi:selenocysteine-specific elongation factor
MPRHLILGTAGHIDHGKTALVRALTGVDTDRLPEEKRRGITIDLGFARMQLGDVELGIVDVPGHEAFVRNMLAGATGIDIVLFVIAADESVMPQTREHLAIIELLGIQRAVIALTKSDLVEADWLELVREEVRELLAPSALAGSAIVAVSARTGDGITELTEALSDAAANVPPRPTDDLFRMPIDRVFTVRGTGTVVTGTVWSGALARDTVVRIEPAGLTARVRALQRHGADATHVHAGERAAIALAGIERAQLDRGDTVISAPTWRAGTILTARIEVIRDADAPIRPRQRVRVHLGTAEVLGRVTLLQEPLEPGADAIVQLRLEGPLLARAGDHIVIRSYSPVHTIAGGIVLEPAAAPRKRLDDSTRALLEDLRPAALLALRAGRPLARAELPVLTGGAPADIERELATLDVVELPDGLVMADHIRACATRVREALAAYHCARPLEEGMDRESLRRAAAADVAPTVFERALQDLAAGGDVVGRGGGFALATHQPEAGADQRPRLDQILAHLRAAGLEAPEVDELAPHVGATDLPPLLRFLERDGQVIRISHTRFADPDAIARAVSELRAQLPVQQPLGIGDFRDVLKLSRKHLIPLLEYLDRTGITVRAGDERVLLPPPGA